MGDSSTHNAVCMKDEVASHFQKDKAVASSHAVATRALEASILSDGVSFGVDRISSSLASHADYMITDNHSLWVHAQSARLWSS